jgi:hypothetical protein
VRLWEPFSGLQIAALQGHQGPVTGVAFARDGRSILSASTDTSLLAWDGTGQMKGGQFPAFVLDPPALTAGWTILASEDAKRGHDMLWQMVASPKEVLTFLDTPGQLQLVDPQRINQLFKDLSSPKFNVRDKATRDLERYGEWMRGRLEEALKQPEELEVELRLQAMLKKLNAGTALSLRQERIRLRRTMMILEQIADERAVTLLQSLAKGAPEVDLQQEAEDSLRRLGKSVKAGS